MSDRKDRFTFPTAKITAATFGVLAGIGGMTHGIGEVLQGSVAPEGIFILSWAEGPIYDLMGGDPGMTLVPNMLVTGVLCLLASLAVVVWSAFFVDRRYGGRVLALLSILMMLVGGGFGSPITGLLAAAAAGLIHAPLAGWRSRLTGLFGRTLARLYPWVFTLSVLNAAFLFLGALALTHFFRFGNAELYSNSFLLVVVSLPVTILTGIAYDLHRETRAAQPGRKEMAQSW